MLPTLYAGALWLTARAHRDRQTRRNDASGGFKNINAPVSPDPSDRSDASLLADALELDAAEACHHRHEHDGAEDDHEGHQFGGITRFFARSHDFLQRV